MAYETLLYEVDDRVATIRLNRPERHNALSQKLSAEMIDAVRTADQDPALRMLVITGAGGKAFSAGYDIKESAEAPKRSLSEWRDRLNRDLRFTYSVWELLDATNTPEYARFDELRRTKGLGEALRWRHAQFAPFE